MQINRVEPRIKLLPLYEEGVFLLSKYQIVGIEDGRENEMISVQNLTKSYGENVILIQINLDIQEGEFVSIIGPSGCGKSTLVNIIAGLDKASSGKVKVDGKEVKDTDTDRMMVFQSPALFPWLSVYNNVASGLKNICKDKDEIHERVCTILKKVYLLKYKDYYPHQISGGMKQRVALARSMVMNPKVLLMDEPFSALDEQTRMLLHSELQQIWLETRKTIIFVTHNIREAVKLSTRVVILGTRPGTIVEQMHIGLGYPRELENSDLFYMEKVLYGKLKAEMEKVVKEELGNDYSFEKDNIFDKYNNTLGGGI